MSSGTQDAGQGWWGAARHTRASSADDSRRSRLSSAEVHAGPGSARSVGSSWQQHMFAPAMLRLAMSVTTRGRTRTITEFLEV
ncbi:hypothetical protein CP966_02905 [Streptomyces galilaeus]|nr:hypothetical protein CP966_02905 [Streptomyces galilaeus]